MESKHWWAVLAMGVLSVITGIIALLNPFTASLAATTIAGVAFLIIGAVSMWAAWKQSLMTVIAGALAVVLGVSILLNPLAGMVSLTLMVGILIGAMGVLRIIAAFQLRPHESWLVVLVSGLVSVFLAALILLNFPASAASILGIFLGIDLMMNGMFLSVFGYALRPGDDFHPEDVFPGIDRMKEQMDEQLHDAAESGDDPSKEP